MPRYVGLNCTTKCPYPSYGEKCQEYCNCNYDTCDVSTGCVAIKTSPSMFLNTYF